MDDYPSDYVAHNLPLILLSGLGPEPEKQTDNTSESQSGPEPYPLLKENAIQIFSDFPLLTDSTATIVLNALLSQDASDTIWSSEKEKERSSGTRLRIKRVGRVGQHAFCKYIVTSLRSYVEIPIGALNTTMPFANCEVDV